VPVRSSAYLSAVLYSIRKGGTEVTEPNNEHQTTDQFHPSALVRFPFTNGKELVYLPLARRVEILPRHEIEKLNYCAGFATLEEHADSIAQHLPYEERGDTIHALQRLASIGAFVGQTDLLSMAMDLGSGPNNRGRISMIAVPTCDRPDELERCLLSYIHHCKVYGRSVVFLIADNSDDIRSRNETRALLHQLGRETDVEIRYAGLEEKMAFVDALSAHDIPRDIATFALTGLPCGHTRAGSNRNTILLGSLGRLLLSVDDDTICSLGTVSTLSEREIISIGSEINPTQYWFFHDREAAHRFVAPIDADLLAAHEMFLGRRLGAVYSSAVSEGITVDMKAICAHLLAQLAAGKGQILTTYNGMTGDSGMSSQTSFVFNEGVATKNRMAASPEAMRLALESRELVRQVLSPSIGHGRQGNQTMFVGLDNRVVIPPFLPAFRNQDGVFETTLTQITGDFCSGYVPLSLPHSPHGKRTYIVADCDHISVSEIVAAAIAGCSFGYPDHDVESRYRTLGEELVGIGSLGTGEFSEWLKIVVCGRASAFVTGYEALLTRYGYDPPYWADELERRIENLSRAATESAATVPREFLRSALKSEEAMERTRSIVYQFGRLLSYWPAIVEVTRSLAPDGWCLGADRQDSIPVSA
jgi:hypothetical protein